MLKAFKIKLRLCFNMSILLNYLKDYWRLGLSIILLAIINQTFSLLDPWIFRYVIDNYATKFDTYTLSEFVKGVGFLLLCAIGVAFVSRVAKSFQDYYLNTIIQKIGAKMYSDGIAHSLGLPYEVFEDQRSGETLGKLQKVRTDIEKFLTLFINIFFISLVGMIFIVIYAFTINWIIALVFFSTIPVVIFVSLTLSSRIKQYQKEIVSKTNALSGTTTESLRNIELIKSLGLSSQEINRLNSTTDKILGLELSKIKYMRYLSFAQGTTINFLRNLILFIMLYFIFTQSITFGEFFSLFMYSFLLFGPLQEIGNVITSYRETEVSLNNFKDILNMNLEPKSKNPVKIGKIENIKFDNIEFQYISSNRNAISNVSFEVEKGKSIAFVGPSGSGKTTLVKLLLGLYKPMSGKILYNGKNYSQIDIDEFRNEIGLVTQDTQLFAGTIRENLLFVNPYATDKECMDVLKQASALSILDKGDKNLSTIIGENGIKLSGGEKQRLSIARALLRKPSILIFDEATSALDSITEEEINKTIRDVTDEKSRITILIAHRLSTVMHCDTIYVLEKGNIVEFGKHEDLLEKKGLYYAMWRQQIGEV